MAKAASVSTKLLNTHHSRPSPLSERLNKQVLQTIRDLAGNKLEEDPGIEDEYEFEIFGNTGPKPPKHKK